MMGLGKSRRAFREPGTVRRMEMSGLALSMCFSEQVLKHGEAGKVAREGLCRAEADRMLSLGAFAVLLCIVQQAGSVSKEHSLHFDPGSLSLKKMVNRLLQRPLRMLVLNEECLQPFDSGK